VFAVAGLPIALEQRTVPADDFLPTVAGYVLRGAVEEHNAALAIKYHEAVPQSFEYFGKELGILK